MYRDLTVDRKMHLYCARYQVDFVNIDNPEDYCRTVVDGHANDNGDKAPGKGISYAIKYSMLKTFSIETGESDESRAYEEPEFTDLQKEEFDSILDKKAGLSYAVFSRKHGPDVMGALQRTFPDGKVSQGKKLCKELDQSGWDTLRTYASDIGDAVNTGDATGLLQLTGELTDDEKRVLGGILRPEDITAIQAAKEI